MIDIHHHLLFGLDDGSPDIETSVQMAEMASADGITHIVCTPHASADFAFQPEENAIRFAQLQQAVTAKLGDKLALGLGCDFHLSYENITDAMENPTKYTINQKNYLLIEFPTMGIAPAMPDYVYELVRAGMTPIITHPERNASFIERPEKLNDYLKIGCLVQVTGGSILGAFGRIPQRAAISFLEQDLVDIVASDAHNIDRRRPLLRAAYDEVATNFGEDTAERLFVTTPRAAFYGEQRPAPTKQPPALAHPAERKRSLLSRLFSD
jgi:protein-tyrosine phosphatase